MGQLSGSPCDAAGRALADTAIPTVAASAMRRCRHEHESRAESFMLGWYFVVVWGSGYLASKTGLQYAAPFTFLSLRYVFGIACMIPVVLVTRPAWPSGRRELLHVCAAGLLMHLPDPAVALTELARVTAEPGVLILFHPSGRAALAARHGRELRPDDTLGCAVLTGLLAATGWRLRTYDDAEHRFFAVAERVGQAVAG